VPIPLPNSIVSVLTADPAAALAALMIISNKHADLFSWATRNLCPPPARKRGRSNGAGRPARAAGRDVYLSRRRKARDRDDEKLLEAMRLAPGGSIKDWAEAIGKSRSSTVSALHRLRDAGLAANEDGVWALTEPREPAPKWIEPVSGSRRAHAHAGA
jgi:hypothetical protein